MTNATDRAVEMPLPSSDKPSDAELDATKFAMMATQAACDLDHADPDHDETLCISIDDLHVVVERLAASRLSVPREGAWPLPRVTFDPEVDAGYIYLSGKIEAGAAKRQIPVGGMNGFVLDLDANGALIGVEVLSGKLLHLDLRAVADIRPLPKSPA